MPNTKTTEITPDRFPEDPKHEDIWLCWRYEVPPGQSEVTKVPKRADRKGNAKTNDPKTWSPFEKAVQAYKADPGYFDGIGMVFQDDDPWIGVDLDGCRSPETGEVDPWALEIIEELDTYTEVSPSGTGVKAWTCGHIPHNSYSKKFKPGEKPGIEMYAAGRWFAVTGLHLEGTPHAINRRTTQLTKLAKKHWPDKFKVHEAPRATENGSRNGSGHKGGEINLEEWLPKHGVPVAGETSDNQGRKWKLQECPRSERHSTQDASGAYVGQMHGDSGPHGAIYARCSHAGCGGGDLDIWHDLRRAYQPDWEPHKTIKINRPSHSRTHGGNTDSNDSNDSVFQDLVDLPDPADFPTEALPSTTRQFVREAAASIGCPVDYLATSVLAALSTAIGDTRRIVLKKDWSEGTAIFAAIVGGPASKKTPAMNTALKPVRERQLILKREYERQKDEYKSKLREHEKLTKKGPVEYSPPKKPTLGRTYADDTTVERFADTLNENPRGVLVAKDELSGWLGGMNQYKQGGKGADRQFWLSVHTNQSIVVDRKSLEEPVIVPRPFASVIGGIQPDVLPDFGKDRGDGLLDRFVFSYPPPQLGEWSDDEISDEARDGYAETIKRLYRLEHAQDARGAPFPSRVQMTAPAKELFVAEYNRLHKELEDPGFPQRLRPAWGKLEAYLARFSLVLAMTRTAETARAGGYEEITEEDMSGAIKLLAYYKHQARRVYTGLYGDSPSDRLAADLRDFLLRMSGTWEGIASELHRALDSEHKPERPEDLSKAVRSIAKRSSLLRWDDLKRTQNRRPFRLTLKNAVIAVIADMPSEEDDAPDEEMEVGR